jgi:serine/threonine protein kinase
MTDVSPVAATSWEFEEGAPIAKGRSVLKRFHTQSELYDTYLVWDEWRYAIMVAKLIRPDRVGDGSAHRALHREVRALKRLQHPAVVRAFDAEPHGPHPHVLLEHLEGFNLRSVVHRQGPLPTEQILPLALHMASALHYFASESYVHLDVKPENIIMGVPPKLIDLSLARSAKDCENIKSAVGTDAFMAPEQCMPGAGAPIGPPADVWGLGATLYYASTHTLPFPRPPREERYSPADRWPQLADDPVPLPEAIPEPLREIIWQALRRQPDERPTASELAVALEPLVSEQPRGFLMSKYGWRPF